MDIHSEKDRRWDLDDMSELPLLDETLTFTYDHRIASTHPERPIDIEEALASECASRLRLQTILSAVWTTASRNGDVCEILEREFPPV